MSDYPGNPALAAPIKERVNSTFQQALSLYRGDFLTSLKSDWVANRRESLQQAGCDALITLGKLCESANNPREALGHYLRASRLKPEREDSTHAVMRLYLSLNMRDDAHKAYRRLVKTLNDRLHVSPSPQVQQLAAHRPEQASVPTTTLFMVRRSFGGRGDGRWACGCSSW